MRYRTELAITAVATTWTIGVFLVLLMMHAWS
jgi:hypothetical protein